MQVSLGQLGEALILLARRQKMDSRLCVGLYGNKLLDDPEAVRGPFLNACAQNTIVAMKNEKGTMGYILSPQECRCV